MPGASCYKAENLRVWTRTVPMEKKSRRHQSLGEKSLLKKREESYPLKYMTKNITKPRKGFM